jgi:hypothetical protein
MRLLHHELLGLHLLLLEMLHDLLVVVIDLSALLLRNMNGWILLQDLREFVDLHSFVKQRLLLLILSHRLLESRLTGDRRHCHSVLHLSIILLHLGEVSCLLAIWNKLARHV